MDTYIQNPSWQPGDSTKPKYWIQPHPKEVSCTASIPPHCSDDMQPVYDLPMITNSTRAMARARPLRKAQVGGRASLDGHMRRRVDRFLGRN